MIPVLLRVFLFLASFIIAFILFWPTLWSNPLRNFLECYGMMSHFSRWGGDLLFNGKLYKGTNLPWMYLPEWFCISTPIVWLLAGISGIVTVIALFLRNPYKSLLNPSSRFYLACMALFLLPILMVIFLNSVVYDDWRHVYFIYVPFVVLALFIIDKLVASKKTWATVTILACSAQFILIAVFMVKNHPFESVYLNEFVPRTKDYIKNHLEMDYWACSQKQGLDYILAHDTSNAIRVATHPPLENNLLLLTPAEKKRVSYVDRNENPDYYIFVYRANVPDDRTNNNVLYEINVLNSPIMKVYKLH